MTTIPIDAVGEALQLDVIDQIDGAIATLKRPTQYKLSQGEAWRALEEIADCDSRDGMVLGGYEALVLARSTLKNKSQQEEAPGAEAVAAVLAAANEVIEEFRRATPDDTPAMRAVDRLLDRISALRSVPVPAPGVTVTEEMVKVALDAFFKAQVKIPRGRLNYYPDPMRAALSAALRPKE